MMTAKTSEWRRIGERRLAAVLTAVLLVLSAAVLLAPAAAFAAGGVDVNQNDTSEGMQGEADVDLAVTITNKTGAASTFYGVLDEPADFTAVKGESDRISLGDGQSGDLHFRVDISNTASEGSRYFPIKIYQEGKSDPVAEFQAQMTVGEKRSAPKTESGYLPALDIDYVLGSGNSIAAGQKNELKITLFNKGNCLLKNTLVNLELPEGIVIDSGAATQSAGYLFVGDTYTVKFNLLAEGEIENKSYPIKVIVNFKDQGSTDQTLTQTLYIPVIGGTSAATLKGVEISDIAVPQQVLGSDEFTLQFQVKNKGEGATPDIKVTVEPGEGLVNKTQNVFAEPPLEKGGSKAFAVTLFTTDRTVEKSYPIKITVEPAHPAGKPGETAVTQYASVYVKAETTKGAVKTPQLMVESYRYGGSFVQAGDQFKLEIGFYNTSDQELRNIKATFTSTDGVFIPVGGSNSLYISQIPAKGRVGQSLTLSVKPDAEQKTTAMDVEMVYEDSVSNTFNAKDMISIPVMQETKLMVDDIAAPPEIYAGNPSSVSVQFYNMGKTMLSNLKVTAEGDFDTTDSNSYFAGNMEAGKSDSFDFSFIPRQAGTLEGTVIFTYEDASGGKQTYEKPFAFEVAEMPPVDDGETQGQEPPEEERIPWAGLGIVAAVIAAAAGIYIWNQYQKKKKDRELEIDE